MFQSRLASRLLSPAVMIAAGAGLIAISLTLPPTHGDDRAIVTVHDISDLLRKRPDFPAPRLELQGLEEEEGGGWTDVDEEEDGGWDADELVDLIKRTVSPEIWDEPGNSITHHRGKLIVTTTPAVNTRLQTRLAALRTGAPLYLIQTHLVEIPTAELDSWRLFRDSAKASRAVSHEELTQAEQALKKSIESGRARVVSLPRVVIFPRERNRLPLGHSGAEPTVETSNPVLARLRGVILEFSARPESGARVGLDWKVNTDSRELTAPPRATEKLSAKPKGLEGTTILANQDSLVIRGLQGPRGPSDREIIAVVQLRRS